MRPNSQLKRLAPRRLRLASSSSGAICFRRDAPVVPSLFSRLERKSAGRPLSTVKRMAADLPSAGAWRQPKFETPLEHAESLARHAVLGEVWEKAVDYLGERGHLAYYPTVCPRFIVSPAMTVCSLRWQYRVSGFCRKPSISKGCS